MNNHWDTPQDLFQGFIVEPPPSRCTPTLFNPRLSIMIYDNTIVLNAVMETIPKKISTYQYYSFYEAPFGTIMNVTAELKSIQEQWVTPLVENGNQQ